MRPWFCCEAPFATSPPEVPEVIKHDCVDYSYSRHADVIHGGLARTDMRLGVRHTHQRVHLSRMARLPREQVEDKPAADVDVLTAEEEYLLKVFRRYSKNGNTAASPATAAALGSQKLPQAGNSRRSPSPPAPKTSPPFPGMKSAADKASSDGTPGGAAGAMATDTVSRAKMILEKKRKAAAGLGLSRASSAASSGASGLRKAKITKVAGTPSSSALDPVKVSGCACR